MLDVVTTPSFEECHAAGMTCAEATAARGLRSQSSARAWEHHTGKSFARDMRRWKMAQAEEPLPEFDFEEPEARDCRALWAAVLFEMWRVVFQPHFDTAVGERQQSIAWFRSRDMHMVCALAGLDGEAVRDRFNAALAKFRGQQ